MPKVATKEINKKVGMPRFERGSGALEASILAGIPLARLYGINFLYTTSP